MKEKLLRRSCDVIKSSRPAKALYETFTLWSQTITWWLFNSSSTAYLIVYRGKNNKKSTRKSFKPAIWTDNHNFPLHVKASGSLREKVKDRQHEHLDEQRGCREEQKRRHGESDAHGKETRRNQESQVRKERSKEALSHQGRGEGGEARREKKVSSVKEVEDDLLFLDEKQKASHWSKQHPDDWTKADKRKLRSKKEEGEVENIYIL